MKIVMTNVFVDDQDRTLHFYTEVLGFAKKNDIPLGEHRWLTVVSKPAVEGVELALEPSSHPAVKPFKSALVDDGIPHASFGVNDVQAEYDRLSALDVKFTRPPVNMGPVTTAVPDDTRGNLIQIAQMNG